MTPKQWISGIVQNLYTVLEGVFAKKTEVSSKQDTLVSGTNIKTINSTSVLGSGNFDLVPKSGGTMNDDATLGFVDSSGEFTLSIMPQRIELKNDSDGFDVAIDSMDPGLSVCGTLYSGDYICTGANGSNPKLIYLPSSAGTLALTSQVLPKSGGWLDDGALLFLGDSNGDSAVSIKSQHIRAENDDDGYAVELDATAPGLRVEDGGASTIYGLGRLRFGNAIIAYPSTSGTLALISQIPSVSGKEDTSNKVTSLSSSSTDTQYPSAKCVYDLIGDIETLINAL